MVSNSPSAIEAISIEQGIALIAINIIGLVCIGSIFYLMREKTPEPKAKLIMSAKIGVVFIILFAVFSGDLGISFWVESGNFQTVTLAIPLFICGSPFVFPIVVMGAYIQLIYRDKIQEFVNAHKR
ncbi:MAG: hypothetical protein JW726_12215 [Anaerolineales bacterium]|nr:hypothetical protein [Anaerolineales bacterium]